MTVPMLKVFLERAPGPPRGVFESTGIEGILSGATHLEPRQFDTHAIELEAWESFCRRVAPITADWPETDRAILVMRAQGATVREVCEHLQVSPNRVCKVNHAIERWMS